MISVCNTGFLSLSDEPKLRRLTPVPSKTLWRSLTSGRLRDPGFRCAHPSYTQPILRAKSMPTFDREKRAYGLDAGTIDFAKGSVDFLRSRKVAVIPLAEANGFRLSNSIRIFVQSHVRR